MSRVLLLAASMRPPTYLAARRSVIIDTDSAIDDAIAMVLLPALLITSVGGILSAQQAAATARRLVAPLSAEGAAPPVCAGLDPVRNAMQDAPWAPKYSAQCISALDDIALPADAGHAARAPALDAASAIAATAQQHPGATLVCLGPLTNIAEVVRRESGILSRLGELVVLGGAVRRAGSAPHGAEWNFAADPSSAAQVFAAVAAAGTKLVLLANDVANDDAISEQSPLVRALCEPVACGFGPLPAADGGRAWHARRQCIGRRLVALQPEALTMDPLASAFVLDPSVFELEDVHLRVDPVTGVTTECGLGEGTLVRLATRIDTSAYERLLREELLDDLPASL